MKKLFLITFIFLLLSNLSFADEIKPGIVITKDNYEKYLKELKTLMPESLFNITIERVKKGLTTMPIVETKRYKGWYGREKWTKKCEGLAKVSPNGELINYVGGMPFASPKTGLELAWNLQRSAWWEQGSCYFSYSLYDRKGVLERAVAMLSAVRVWVGRTGAEPIPSEPNDKEGIFWKMLAIFREPFDARGFTILRERFLDPRKEDNTWAYFPTLRRIRRMTGSDTQDPLFGTDYTFDDFACAAMRIDPKIIDYKIIGKRVFLIPSYYDHQDIRANEFDRKRGIVHTEWEKREHYILEFNIKDPTYMYSKKLQYVDAQYAFPDIHYQETFDQRGRLWRTNYQYLAARVDKEFWTYNNGEIIDHQSGHRSIVTAMDVKNPDPQLTVDYFNLRTLIKLGR